MNTENLKNILSKGLEQGAYPCCAAAVGKGDEVLFRFSAGHRALFPEKLPLTEDTLFDMASLSKLMGTTMACLRMMEKGKIS
ncbi:MAG: serine hydrolase, partial [Clostridia bacterium]|nr:serine hydrolase [Clostridia bacterium]